MTLFRFLFHNFPAASRAVVCALSVSLMLLFAARFGFYDPRPSIFLLGDSGIGNYRLDPGQRFQDFLERMNPEKRVENWAEPGATPMDYFLQFCRGTLVAGKPQSVVIALGPDKFLTEENHRFDEAGVNLRWIPWNKTGLELFRRLSPREKRVACVQQAGLAFYAVADVGRSFWIRYVQWPWERNQMHDASGERRRRIEEKAREMARVDEQAVVDDDATFDSLPRARDAAFLLRSLRAEGVDTRVIILPFGNSELIHKTCSPIALAHQDTLIVRMRSWLEDQDEAYIDFNAPEERSHFPDSVWDDVAHLKSPSAFAHMAEKVEQSLNTPASKTVPIHLTMIRQKSAAETHDFRN